MVLYGLVTLGGILANIKSQKKRIITSRKNQERNKQVKSLLKTDIKKLKSVIESDGENKQEQLVKTVSTIDRAAKKGVIHKKNAARKKSRLTKKLAG